MIKHPRTELNQNFLHALSDVAGEAKHARALFSNIYHYIIKLIKKKKDSSLGFSSFNLKMIVINQSALFLFLFSLLLMSEKNERDR